MADREPPETIQISLGEMRFVPARQKGIRWKKIGAGYAAARTVALNVLFLASFIAAIILIREELFNDSIVIRPIGLPNSLKEIGYSEEMAARRLWDEIQRVRKQSATVKRAKGLQLAPDQNSPSIQGISTPISSPNLKYLPSGQWSVDFEAPGKRVDLDIPGTGVSLNSIAAMIGRLIEDEKPWITGEFICMTAKCKPEGLTLRLRVSDGGGMRILQASPIVEQANQAKIEQKFRGDGMKTIFLPPVGDQTYTYEAEIDRYFRAAAAELVRDIDPYVFAVLLYQTDKAAARREALQLIAPTDPQRKWALNLLGFIAADSGDYDGAISWYQRAIAADEEDDFAIAYASWGDALRAKGDLDGAIAKYMRAIEIDPEDAAAYTNWGNALYSTGDLAGAIAKYKRAAKLDPESGFAYNSWGNALYNRGDLDAAIAKYMRAIELDPEDALAYYNWGIALDDKGELDGAIAKYKRATELDPEYAGAYTNWGIALRRMGDLDGAMAKFQRATKLDPESAFAYYNWGGVLGNMGDLDGAIAKFMYATELDPEYASAHFNKAIALQMLGRAGDAADAFQRYLELRPDAGNAEQVRAQIEQLRADPTNN